MAGACGGGSNPSDHSTPTPPPGSPVSGFVFYDENGNGVPDAGESVRLPAVTVAVGARTGQSAAGGRFTVDAVPQGSQSASARPETLPAYFIAGAPVTVNVPQTGDLAVPVTLPLGDHARPNVYLAFGDSITVGEGSSDGGYLSWLQADLNAYWGGRASVLNAGQSGTKSNKGENRVGQALESNRPAYLLILYGTNDWNDSECKDTPPCYTIDALRSMVVQAREKGAEPVLGTIPPVNPLYVDKQAEERNAWVRQMNDSVRAMARQQQVSIAEVHGDFMKQPSLPALFTDDKHPNDTGYRVMSRSFFNAITRPYSSSGSSARHSLFHAFSAR